MNTPEENEILIELLDIVGRQARTISRLSDELAGVKRFADHVAGMHTCNDCGSCKACGHRPAPGESVRYNCPLWSPQGRTRA